MYVHSLSTTWFSCASVIAAHKRVDRIKCRKPNLSAEHVKETLFWVQPGNYTSRKFTLLLHIQTNYSNPWLDRRWKSEAKQSWSRPKPAGWYAPLPLSFFCACFVLLYTFICCIYYLKQGTWYWPLSTPKPQSIPKMDNHDNQVSWKWVERYYCTFILLCLLYKIKEWGMGFVARSVFLMCIWQLA